MVDINGKVIVVTGASSGIGEATARLAASRGARVVLAARRADRLAAIAEDLPEATYIATDLTDTKQVEAMVEHAIAIWGRIDVLVNNAGRAQIGYLETAPIEEVEDTLRVNVLGPFRAMQAVVPHLRRQGGGVIINVSSGVTKMDTVLPGQSAYTASKAALDALSAVAREELAPDNITVSTIFPYLTETVFWDIFLDANNGDSGGLVPDPPAKVAEAILDLITTGEAERLIHPGD